MVEKLRPKYLVSRVKIDGSPDYSTAMKATDPRNPSSPFVLMPQKDPAAFLAVLTYANYCEPDLASEIRAWLNLIAKDEPKFGTQGTRNQIHMRQTLIVEAMRA